MTALPLIELLLKEKNRMNKFAGNGLLCDKSFKILPLMYFQMAKFNVIDK